MKPLCGKTYQLKQNLESFLDQDYPEYEIIFCAEKIKKDGGVLESDPALSVVDEIFDEKINKTKDNNDIITEDNITDNIRTVVIEEQNRKITLKRIDGDKVGQFTGFGRNPVARSMKLMFDASNLKYKYIMKSDDDVRIDKNCLKSMIAEFSDKKVEAVTSRIRALDQESIGSIMNNIFFNGRQNYWMCFLSLFNFCPMHGKTCMIKKNFFEKHSIKNISHYIVEDAYIIRQLSNTRLSYYVVDTYYNNKVKLKAVTNRYIRWNIAIATMLYHTDHLHLFCLPSIYLAGLAIFHPVFALSGLTLRILCDIYLMYMIKTPIYLSYIFWIPFQDFFLLYIWFMGSITNTVTWCGKTYTVAADGKIIKNIS